MASLFASLSHHLNPHLRGGFDTFRGHCRIFAEVPGPCCDLSSNHINLCRQWMRKTDVHDDQLQLARLGEGIDGSSTARKVHNHLRRDRLRVRTDPLFTYSMIAGKEQYPGPIDTR